MPFKMRTRKANDLCRIFTHLISGSIVALFHSVNPVQETKKKNICNINNCLIYLQHFIINRTDMLFGRNE